MSLPPVWSKNRTVDRQFGFEVYQSYAQFTWTDQWLHCSYEHVLHSVNALLLCMSAAGFRQCALCLLLGNSFFTPLQRWICRLFLNVIGRQTLSPFSFTHSAQSHSLSPSKWPFVCVLLSKVHMKFSWIWFYCQSVVKIKEKTFSLLFFLNFNQLLRAHIFLKYLVLRETQNGFSPHA